MPERTFRITAYKDGSVQRRKMVLELPSSDNEAEQRDAVEAVRTAAANMLAVKRSDVLSVDELTSV